MAIVNHNACNPLSLNTLCPAISEEIGFEQRDSLCTYLPKAHFACLWDKCNRYWNNAKLLYTKVKTHFTPTALSTTTTSCWLVPRRWSRGSSLSCYACAAVGKRWSSQRQRMSWRQRRGCTSDAPKTDCSSHRQTSASDWLPRPIKVSIFKEVRSVMNLMILVDLAQDMWDASHELDKMISDEEHSS